MPSINEALPHISIFYFHQNKNWLAEKIWRKYSLCNMSFVPIMVKYHIKLKFANVLQLLVEVSVFSVQQSVFKD